jgi:hypothetical protein
MEDDDDRGDGSRDLQVELVNVGGGSETIIENVPSSLTIGQLKAVHVKIRGSVTSDHLRFVFHGRVLDDSQILAELINDVHMNRLTLYVSGLPRTPARSSSAITTSDVPKKALPPLLNVSKARWWIWAVWTFIAAIDLSWIFILSFDGPRESFNRRVGLEQPFYYIAQWFLLRIIIFFALAVVFSWLVGFGFLGRRTLQENVVLFFITAIPDWDIEKFKQRYNINVPGEEHWPREPVGEDWQ